MKAPRFETLLLDKIVGGGQALGTLADGCKAFVWGGLPGEQVKIQISKSKSHYIEGFVTEVISPSKERVLPKDPESYLSTSPWQIMDFQAEQHYKAALIEEAFELHDIVLPNAITVYTDNNDYHYRNKVEFGWFGQQKEDGSEKLDLAFFRRGSKGKITVGGSSLLPGHIEQLAHSVRDMLQQKKVRAGNLKTLLIRSDQLGNCVWQLYVKIDSFDVIGANEAASLPALGGEIIFSDPHSPASRITKRLCAFGNTVLTDTILDVPFRYATEGFFQINLPVYEQALKDMQQWVPKNSNVVDLYSGVGSIGLTIGGESPELIEINEDAVREMKRNISELHSSAKAILAPSEKALEYITGNKLVIIDPPRAGLHADVTNRLLEAKPRRIIYLSCNPVTQARDTARLAPDYTVVHHQGYNFFPRTPHIEHLVVLDKKPSQSLTHTQA